MSQIELSTPLADEELRKTLNSLEALQADENFFFIDSADLFIGGEPSAELMTAVEALEARGAKVVILTSDNPNQLSTLDLEAQLTEELGLGNYRDGTLHERAIVCIFNTKKTDGKKEIFCDAGDAFSFLSKSQLQYAAGLIRDSYLDNGNTDEGFRAAFLYIEQIFQARDARATEQARPTATAAPYSEESMATAEPGGTTVQDSGPGFYELHRREVNAGGLTAVVLGALVGTTILTRPKREFVKGVEAYRFRAKEIFSALNADIGTGFSLMSQIESSLQASYPEKAEQARLEAGDFKERWERLKEKQQELIVAKVGFFRKRDNMEDVRTLAQEVITEAQALIGIINESREVADDLHVRTEAAQTNTSNAKTKLSETRDWYEIKFGSFSKILPIEKVAFNAIQELFDQAEQNSYYDTSLALKGSDQALEVLAILDKFTAAVDAFTYGFEVSWALLNGSGEQLKDWPGEAIQPGELASSGVKLLDEAKAGIAVPEKLENVVILSQQAEEQFKYAKDFASAEATVLALRDDNNAAIKKITDQDFFESHVQEIKDEVATALSEANHAASQGKWQEAQSQIGILRVKTNESLAEMQRLKQLHEQNIVDLKAVADELEDTKKQYGSETRSAWNDLRQNFVADNFDESTATWEILRKDMGVEETTNFSGHFVLIAEILEKVTDDPNKDQDIASIATAKNSMKQQEFDEAADLIREMERELARAQQLMAGLLERQKLARKAEVDYQAAINNSSSRLKLAEESIDTPEEDRLVDETVDEQIAEANELIEFAKEAADKLVFVAALEAATKATNLSIQARQSAEDQIRHLKELFAGLDNQKQDSVKAANDVIEEVDEEKDAVITASTNQLLRSLQNKMTEAIDEEKALAAFEDHDLARAIEALIMVYDDDVDGLRSQLDSALEGDRRTYQALLDELEEAIDDAEDSISSASTKCNDSDAGFAGDSSLSSARSSLPGEATWGDKRSDIESKIKAAKQAEEYADSAYSLAAAAISAAETARALKAAQEAADRAAEARRATESVSFNASGSRGGVSF